MRVHWSAGSTMGHLLSTRGILFGIYLVVRARRAREYGYERLILDDIAARGGRIDVAAFMLLSRLAHP